MSYPIASTSNVHAPAANTAAVVTIAGATGKQLVISKVFFGYDAAPTGGSLIIQTGAAYADTVFSLPITSAGPGPLDFSDAKDNPRANVMTSDTGKGFKVTLAAGGAGISGKVNVYWRWV